MSDEVYVSLSVSVYASVFASVSAYLSASLCFFVCFIAVCSLHAGCPDPVLADVSAYFYDCF